MIYTKKDIENILPDAELYNIPSDWSSEGIVMWHENMQPNKIVFVREENETRGIIKNKLADIIDNVSAIVTTASFDDYKIHNKPVIKIKNQEEAIVAFAKFARNKYTGKIISITGSCGKTTCSQMMYDILAKYGSNINKEGNTLCGISWNLTNYDLESPYWVVETSLGGRMLKNSKLLEPDYAVVTNIAPVHLENNQNTLFIAKRKSEIFSHMKKGSYAILYKHSEHFEIVEKAAKEKELNVITYGKKDADIIINCENNNNWIDIFDEKYNIEKEYIPEHILLNMAAVATIAHIEKIEKSHIIETLSNFQCIEGRGEVISGAVTLNKSITVINEAYNANPVSMKYALLDFKARFKDSKNKLLILGDMAEGGENTIKNHINLEPIIRDINPSRILFCGNTMKILWDLLKSDYPSAHFNDGTDVNKDILNWIKDNDNIFIKGSHSTNLFKTVEFLREAIKNNISGTQLNDIYIKHELVQTKQKINELFSKYPNFKPSIFVWEYSKQLGININANKIYPAASIIKIPILIELLKLISEDKKIKLTDTMAYVEKYFAKGSGILKDKTSHDEYTLDYLAEIMISDSDNIASNMLLDKIGGIEYLNCALNNIGFKEIRMKEVFPDLSGKNKITAYEISKMLFNLDNESYIKPEYSQIIKNYLLHTKNTHHIREKLPSHIMFQHKTGSIDLMLGDSGIIIDKINNLKYIITILVEMPYVRGDKETNLKTRKQTKELIQDTSLLIYRDILEKIK